MLLVDYVEGLGDHFDAVADWVVAEVELVEVLAELKDLFEVVKGFC